MQTHVLVAGGGPVGLAMAMELARYGVPVRVIEKAAERTDKSKALVLWSRTLELLHRAGAAAAFVEAGVQVTGIQIVAGAKPIAHITIDVDSPYPYALMLPQSDTERLLEEHLNSLGVYVERRVELTGFTDSGASVVSKLLHPDGREETLETHWLIGCDGAHSTVRHGLGMSFEGDTLPSNWILGDVHLANVPYPNEVLVSWHTDGVLVLFPIRGDRYRVIADVGEGDTGRGDPTLDEIQQVLDRRGPSGMKASQPVWLALFHINERKVKQYRSGRVFLAGDAAHVHSPAGGQGMNTGIQDGCNLAWKLALVCRGAAAEGPLLGSYSPERSAVGDEVLKNAGRLTEVAILRGEVKQSIRNTIAGLVVGLSKVQHAAAEAATELSIGYPESPLNGSNRPVHGGPHAGQRAPIRSGETPVGAGDTPRFVLFADAAGSEGILAGYSDLLEPRIRTSFEPGGLWLVRPDGYVAVATKAGEWGDVNDFLRRIEA